MLHNYALQGLIVQPLKISWKYGEKNPGVAKSLLLFAPVRQYESHQKTCVKTAASAKQLYCCFLSPAAVVTQAPPKVLHYSSSFGDATLFTPYIVLLAGRLSHEDKAWVGKPGDLLNNSHASDGMPPFEFPRSSSGDCCYRSLQLIHAYFCS